MEGLHAFIPETVGKSQDHPNPWKTLANAINLIMLTRPTAMGSLLQSLFQNTVEGEGLWLQIPVLKQHWGTGYWITELSKNFRLNLWAWDLKLKIGGRRKGSEMNLDKKWGSQGTGNIRKSNPEDISVYLCMQNIHAGNIQGWCKFYLEEGERHKLITWDLNHINSTPLYPPPPPASEKLHAAHILTQNFKKTLKEVKKKKINTQHLDSRISENTTRLPSHWGLESEIYAVLPMLWAQAAV